jgi:ribonuclease VapC
MVVDTSIVLAIFFNEPAGPWALDQLQKNRHDLQMSTVNYAEALILIQDRQPRLAREIRDRIEESSLRLVPPTAEQAETAASARLRYPLNLGDCFAYALAKQEDCAVLTLDRAFRRTDIRTIVP